MSFLTTSKWRFLSVSKPEIFERLAVSLTTALQSLLQWIIIVEFIDKMMNDTIPVPRPYWLSHTHALISRFIKLGDERKYSLFCTHAHVLIAAGTGHSQRWENKRAEVKWTRWFLPSAVFCVNRARSGLSNKEKQHKIALNTSTHEKQRTTRSRKIAKTHAIRMPLRGNCPWRRRNGWLVIWRYNSN